MMDPNFFEDVVSVLRCNGQQLQYGKFQSDTKKMAQYLTR